jgi:Tfp pilus assembly pilus retraction ATPase PilT
MNFDFADVLIEVMERGASDLHLTAGVPPMVRERGKLSPLDFPALTPQDTREIVYSILTNDQRKKLENEWQLDLSYSIPNRARFRVNAYFQRAAMGAAFRLIPSASRRCSRSSRRSRVASCSSRVPRAPVSPRRSQRWWTGSTAPATSTS